MGLWQKCLRLLHGTPAQLLLIGAVGALVYSNTFHVPFALDDRTSIFENPVIRNLESFWSGEGYRFDPRRFVGYLSFALNYRFGGLEVVGYHAVNLAIHLCAALLVYALCRLLFKTPFLCHSLLAPRAPWIALTVGLLFIVHPVQTQAVTYIAQRFASLAAMFYLLSLVFFVMARLRLESRVPRLQSLVPGPVSQGSKDLGPGTRDTGPVPRRMAPILLFAGSLLSALLALRTKEIAVTLPFMVLLLEFSFFQGRARRRMLLLAPVLALMVAIPLSLLVSQGGVLASLGERLRADTDMARLDYLLTQFRVIVTYLRLLVFPVNQNLDYDYPVYTSFLAPQVFLSFLLLLALVGLAVYSYWRTRLTSPQPLSPEIRLVGFGIFWFFLALSVESSVIPIADVIFEHRLYLPSTGAFLAVTAPAFLAAQKLESSRSRLASIAPFLALLLGAVVLVLGSATFLRNRVWQDRYTLWQDVVAKSPLKARGHSVLGMYYGEDRRWEEARDELMVAVRLDPRDIKAHNNLGAVFEAQGLLEKAAEEFHAAIKLDPDKFEPHRNLAAVFNKMDMINEAIHEYRRAIELNPNLDASVHCDLGILYGRAGDYKNSIEQLRIAILKDPDHVEANYNLGVSYLLNNEIDKALQQFQYTILLSPGHQGAHQGLYRCHEIRNSKATSRDK